MKKTLTNLVVLLFVLSTFAFALETTKVTSMQLHRIVHNWLMWYPIAVEVTVYPEDDPNGVVFHEIVDSIDPNETLGGRYNLNVMMPKSGKGKTYIIVIKQRVRQADMKTYGEAF